MDGDSIIMLFVLIVLIFFSAYFSSTETAFSSLNKIRIKNMANSGKRKAKLVLKLSDRYDEVLSAILIGNNIVNIAAASIATVFFVNLIGDRGVYVSTVVMTVVVLIFAEISPKSLAKETPEQYAMFSAPFLNIMLIFLKPINFLFMMWKRLLSKILNITGKNTITEEELKIIVSEAEYAGEIDSGESSLIRSAIEFNDLDVSDILIPRIDIIAISSSTSKEEIQKIFCDTGFSRLPVYEDSIDNIIGIINQKDFHNVYMNSQIPLKDILKPAVFTTPTMKISKLLKILQRSKSHFAIISDEYGGILGIVTLEDILEELVGEIWDEHDDIVNEFEQISLDKYKVLGSASVEKMFRMFNIDYDTDVSTINGLILEKLGRMPNVGEKIEIENLVFYITKRAKRKVLEVEILILPKKDQDEDENNYTFD